MQIIEWFNTLSFEVKLFIVVTVLDFITGNLGAGYRGKWDSSNGTRGVYKLLAKISIVIAIEIVINDIQLGSVTETLVLVEVALIIAGTGSVIENLGVLGIQLPKSVTSKFNRLNKEVMDNEETKRIDFTNNRLNDDVMNSEEPNQSNFTNNRKN